MFILLLLLLLFQLEIGRKEQREKITHVYLSNVCDKDQKRIYQYNNNQRNKQRKKNKLQSHFAL